MYISDFYVIWQIWPPLLAVLFGTDDMRRIIDTDVHEGLAGLKDLVPCLPDPQTYTDRGGAIVYRALSASFGRNQSFRRTFSTPGRRPRVRLRCRRDLVGHSEYRELS